MKFADLSPDERAAHLAAGQASSEHAQQKAAERAAQAAARAAATDKVRQGKPPVDEGLPSLRAEVEDIHASIRYILERLGS